MDSANNASDSTQASVSQSRMTNEATQADSSQPFPAQASQKSENDVKNLEGPPIHAELWYSDGTVIVQAERTQFRVYAGILSQHSPVLKEMLAKPAVELVDGCPLLFFPNDTAQDIGYILDALYVPG
jgi:hypothetical protein